MTEINEKLKKIRQRQKERKPFVEASLRAIELRSIVEAYNFRRATRLAKRGLTVNVADSKTNLDEDKWLTAKNGEHFLLGEGGEIKAGMGGKFTGKKPNEAFSKEHQGGYGKAETKTGVVEKITEKDYDNAYAYTTSAYREINTALRDGTQLIGENKAAVEAIDKIIGNSPNLKEGSMIYRGTSTSALGIPDDIDIKHMSASQFKQLKSSLVDGTYSDSAFTSTTSNRDIVGVFTRGSGVGNRGVEMRITCGANAKGASAELFSAYGARESEIVVPRNSTMKITGVTRSMGRLIVEATYGD